MKTQINAERFIANSSTGKKIIFYECDPRKNNRCRKTACIPLGLGDAETGCDATTNAKARHKAGRAFYIYCPRGERVEFLKIYTRSRKVIKKELPKVAKWAAIILASIFLFIAARGAAIHERGYTAIGGEYMILLLPAIYYAAERAVKDWIADLRELRRAERSK